MVGSMCPDRSKRRSKRSFTRTASRAFSLCLVAGLGVAPLACIVRLSDPYKERSADGNVTGPPAVCSAAPAEGIATQSGPKGPHFVGRVYSVKDDPAGTTRIIWSGTTVTARWSGASQLFAKLAVTAEHQNNENQGDAIIDPPSTFYSVAIDGQAPTIVTVDGTRSGEQVIPLASDLGAGDHEVTLVRESDALAGPHLFYGLFTDAAGKAAPAYLPATVRPRRIQIIGDSIACGAGVLGANALCGHTYATERASLAFGALAAAQLDAEVGTIAIRPVGMALSSDPTVPWTMPQLYGCTDPRVDPAQLTANMLSCPSAGDLSKDPAAPQVIVIALGANDLARASATIGDFQTAYEAFLRTVRTTYPKAHVFCTLSPLLTDLNTKSIRTNARSAIQAVVQDLADPKIYALEFPDQGTENGLGCEENPSTRTQQVMADILATAIREKTCW